MENRSPSIHHAYTTYGIEPQGWQFVLGAGIILLLMLAGVFSQRADFPAASLLNTFIRAKTSSIGLLTAQDLHTMAREGQSDAALSYVAAYAERVGRWTPAPGDVVTFDPFLPWRYRGAVTVIDDHRAECAEQQFGGPHMNVNNCVAMHARIEDQVRFGRAMFATRTADGASLPRTTFDDILATYIEEVGHSWQEYFYETVGHGEGARTRKTTRAAALAWAHGREYQVKTYILNLDGRLLWLSQNMRETLLAEICRTSASPQGNLIPSYGPPPGWPYPEAWPTGEPPAGAIRAYCRYMDERI